MKTVVAYFAASRYWSDLDYLKRVCRTADEKMPIGTQKYLFLDTQEVSLPVGDCLIVVPMSGSIQQYVLKEASSYKYVIVYGAYLHGNLPEDQCRKLLWCNAAPALMDIWAVLHRRKPHAYLALDEKQLEDCVTFLQGCESFSSSRLLQIGDTEPWVISNASSANIYERKFGLSIISVPQRELADRYHVTQRKEAEKFFTWFNGNSQRSSEISEDALWDASRMACALENLVQQYHAQGAAIACFHLLSEGTTSCLGVSYLNDCTSFIAACEGDLDSAVTMLLMRQFCSSSLWMANPCLEPDRTVNFSHCTAPICPAGRKMPCVLRSHHESGIGVSLQITFPEGQRVTACRISDEASKITIHRGSVIHGQYENVCRTQACIRFDDPIGYLNNALGCHQVFAFEDIQQTMKKASSFFQLEVIS